MALGYSVYSNLVGGGDLSAMGLSTIVISKPFMCPFLSTRLVIYYLINIGVQLKKKKQPHKVQVPYDKMYLNGS